MEKKQHEILDIAAPIGKMAVMDKSLKERIEVLSGSLQSSAQIFELIHAWERESLLEQAASERRIKHTCVISCA